MGLTQVVMRPGSLTVLTPSHTSFRSSTETVVSVDMAVGMAVVIGSGTVCGGVVFEACLDFEPRKTVLFVSFLPRRSFILADRIDTMDEVECIRGKVVSS